MKYNSDYMYEGNIVKVENGKKVILRKGVHLMVFGGKEKNTLFVWQEPQSAMLVSLILEPEKLSDEQKENYNRTINDSLYVAKTEGQEGEVFVDEESIKTILKPKKR